MTPELRKLRNIWLNVEADSGPAQSLVVSPLLEGLDTSRSLWFVVGGEIVALLLGQYDPGDNADALLIQTAYNLGPLWREVENRDGDIGMKFAQGRDGSGIGEHVSYTVFAAGKGEMWGSARAFDAEPRGDILRGCQGLNVEDAQDQKKAERSAKNQTHSRRPAIGIRVFPQAV